jgi:hypothetical protein
MKLTGIVATLEIKGVRLWVESAKYKSLPNEDGEAIENIESNNVEVLDERIKNPVVLVDAKLLVLSIKRKLKND